MPLPSVIIKDRNKVFMSYIGSILQQLDDPLIREEHELGVNASAIASQCQFLSTYSKANKKQQQTARCALAAYDICFS